MIARQQPTRRTFLTAGIATIASVPLCPAADPDPSRIKIGQIGTKHAHARGKLETILKFSDLYDLSGLWNRMPPAERR